MEKEYRVFRLYQTRDLAAEFQELLTKRNIESKLIDNAPSFDPSFSGSTVQNNFQILVKQQDFEKANELLEQQAQQDLANIDESHYLFEFTNEELQDLVAKPDEWNELDYALAQKILKDRGVELSGVRVEELKKERIKELSKPDEVAVSVIFVNILMCIIGYVTFLFVLFIPILWGAYIWFFKKTLPNGEKVYQYSEKGRKYGKIIFFIGVLNLVMILLALYVFVPYLLH